ncbi:carbonic anhydrase [Ascodesmis nigricans]|uniref:Carbonic anhydrase n=1 Tax=Ascodesmis nigricans TaxID=341454 RepID=A0A4V3SIA7_9PEZI|nr:carbonic anhydrase [Ascodesmis nigricans]
MSLVDNLVSANESYSSSLSDSEKSLPLPPGKKYAVVTCMDARLHPAKALGINLGDAHIIRNAGGSAQDALRSLTISQQLLGTEVVVVVKHTDCGMLTFTNADIKAVIARNLGEDAAHESEGADYLPFPELEDAVREDVQFLKSSPLVCDKAKQSVSGFVYEVETGRVRRVV